MPPNAGPLVAVCANHQQKTAPTTTKDAALSSLSPSIQMKATLAAEGEMGEKQKEEANPRLRRSPPAFGGGFFNNHSISSMAFSPTNHLPSSTHSNLHRCAAFEPSIPLVNNSSSSTFSIAEMSKENVVAASAAVCPAPASQIELEFTLAPSSSSASPSPLQIQIRSPGGDFGQIRLDPTHPNGTFCARKSTRCGHGRWQIRVLTENGENLVLEEEKTLELDGVGRVHFFWTQEDDGKMMAKGGKGKLEMREREMLWIPGTACCPLMEGKKEGI